MAMRPNLAKRKRRFRLNRYRWSSHPQGLRQYPMRIPPSPLRRIVVASGTRTRNSLLAFAPMNDPIKIPKTKNTPQFINLPSPVTRNCMILAEGPVIPSPNSRPVATLSGQAASAINPINTAEKNGCQRFSNNKLSKSRFLRF